MHIFVDDKTLKFYSVIESYNLSKLLDTYIIMVSQILPNISNALYINF